MNEPITFVAKIQPGTDRAWELFDPKQWYVLVYDEGIFNVYNYIEDTEGLAPGEKETPLSSLDLFGNSA